MKKRKKLFGRISAAFLSALMVLLNVFTLSTPLVAEAKTIERGKNIPYSAYPPQADASWSTHIYTFGGQYAYCIEAEKGSPSSADYGDGTPRFDLPLLSAVLCMGPGGPLYPDMLKFWKDFINQ